MSLLEQIEAVVKDMTDNNIPAQIVQVSKAHDNNKCDIVTSTGALRNIDCSGTATAGEQALLIYNDGDAGKPFVLLFSEGGGGGGDLSNYYTKTEVNNIVAPLISDSELNTILSSYVTISYANSKYALINHTHSQYVTRDELHDLDIDLSTIELVDYETNPNGVICFDNLGENLYIKKSNTSGLVKNDGTIDTTHYLSSLPSHNHDGRYYTETEVDIALNGKQATLVSGTNIKTINNTSLLGSGNIDIQGGGGSVIGTGSFSINNQGHLIVELPNAVDNPYFINNNGHLIYDTSNTHNGS